MHILFVADPLASFKIYKDTTFAMMRELQRRGHRVSACEAGRHRLGGRWSGHGRCTRDPAHWRPGGLVRTCRPPTTRRQRSALKDYTAVIMRKDPPFDSEYFYATHLLEQAEREGARVFNQPRALRDHPEKLAIMEFSQFCGPTLVTRSAADIKRFHAEHRDIILKPLDGMGGCGYLPRA